jgi:phytoene synthase
MGWHCARRFSRYSSRCVWYAFWLFGLVLRQSTRLIDRFVRQSDRLTDTSRRSDYIIRPMSPDQYCEQKAAPPGSTLYYSVLFLPQPQRRAVIALYALCRELQDAVDQASDPGVARAKVLWWRNELQAGFAGRPQHPVMHALAPVIREYGLTLERLTEIVEGAQLDLDYNRYPDFATVEVYCYRVAGVACMLTAQILGFTQPATLEFARALGTALELTEIIRDVGADARRNRIYLPLDELSRFGLTADDIIALREDERFEHLMAFQIERAHSYFERAAALLPREDRKAQRANLLMAALQRTLLVEIGQLRGRTMNQRVALTPVRKLWVAWKTWIAS